MRSGSSFILHVAIVLIAISYATADYSKSKSKSKFYEQTIKDLTRKSIVFDKHTPDVFYCIPSKPVGDEKVIVKARPIHKLCEYEGELPKIYRSDCYKDVDESDYACKEKYRIMVSMDDHSSICFEYVPILWMCSVKHFSELEFLKYIFLNNFLSFISQSIKKIVFSD